MYDKIRNPIQWNIAAAICRFQLSFWGTNENYLNAPLFENVCFLKAAPRRGARNPGKVALAQLREELRNNHKEKIVDLRLNSFVVDNRIVGFADLCRNTDIPFSVNEYMSLLPAINFARLKYGNRPGTNGKCVKLIQGIYSRKCRSKTFRKYLDNSVAVKDLNELRTVRTFFELIGCEIPDTDILSDMYSLWNSSFLPNKIKVFCFQFVNNSLATGPRLAGRYRNDINRIIDERCVFCLRGGLGVPAREDFFHVFSAVPHCSSVSPHTPTNTGIA
jgi:hypothetical protein